jgi:DNA repair exonuclease SbcCD nuclease subunit
MITQIIHLADLHIRAGDSAKSRYSEYELVMNRIIEDLSTYKPILNKETIIVIAGDIFHHKLKIESPGLKLSIQFISGLAKLAEVYIIRGNHDYKQAYPDEPDLIESLLSIDILNVTYLNKTGHYKVHNIGFGLVSIQDALFSGNTHGITQDLPDFPTPKYFDDDSNIQYKIALFHGPISKTRLPNGMEIMEGHSYPLEWFNGYDSIMLGDIHLQQVNNSKKISITTDKSTHKFKHSIIIDNHLLTNKLTWAYPGSTVQQDFGETLIGHGFLIWDLPTKNIQCYHTHNDYGYVTIKNSDTEWLVNMKTQFENKWVSLQKLVEESWFPKNIYLRIKTLTKKYDLSISNEIYTLFQQYNINIVEIRQDYIGNNNNSENNKNDSNNSHEIIDLASFNTPSVWIEYLQDKIIKENISDWKSWLSNKDFLKLPSTTNNINKAIISKINDKNSKFNKNLDDYQSDNDSQHNLFTIKKPFIFNYIQWDYILCYRDNNHFNFDNLEDTINSITAKNAQGKTSFLETICIALFGNGFPSRHNKNHSASIICQEKPAFASAKTIIHLTINNIKYIITREFNTISSDINKIMCQSNYTTLNMIQNDNIINIHTGKTAVDTWVDTYIGTIQSFLLSCMISQNVDMDFFSLKSSDQKELLDNALCINTSTKFHILLKESKLNHSSLIDTIKTFMTSFSNNTKFIDYPQKIINIKKNLEDDIKHKDLISTSYEKFNKKIYNANLTNTSLFKLCKSKLDIKILEFKKEYESISNNITGKDINNITLEIGAYNNHLKNIGVENILKKQEKENISKNIININKQIQNIQKPSISYDDVIAQNNLYNQFLDKHHLEFINYNNNEFIKLYQDNYEDTIESIQNYITQTKQKKNDNLIFINKNYMNY